MYIYMFFNICIENVVSIMYLKNIPNPIIITDEIQMLSNQEEESGDNTVRNTKTSNFSTPKVRANPSPMAHHKNVKHM